MNTNIIIVDSSVLFANAMRLLIENIFHKYVLAILTFEDDLIKNFQNNMPDIALIAFDNTNKEQLNTINKLLNQFPETKFIALKERKDNNNCFDNEYGFNGSINKLNFINDFKKVLDSFDVSV